MTLLNWLLVGAAWSWLCYAAVKHKLDGWIDVALLVFIVPALGPLNFIIWAFAALKK